MEIVRIAVLVSGGGTNLQTLMDELKVGNSPGRVALAISNRREAYGLERARQAGVDALYIGRGNYPDAEARGQALLEALEAHGIQWVVLAGYLDILPAAVVQRYPNRILNIHPALIPAFCGMGFHGLKVHAAAIERGVKLSGATVHFVDEGADTGPILCQEAVPVLQDDTPETLQKRVLAVEHRLLVTAVEAAASGRIRWVDGKPWL
jgi:phosphoribosylglycinamide formyltransferase-1